MRLQEDFQVGPHQAQKVWKSLLRENSTYREKPRYVKEAGSLGKGTSEGLQQHDVRRERRATLLLYALYTSDTMEPLPPHLTLGLQVSLPPNYELRKGRVSRRNHSYGSKLAKE